MSKQKRINKNKCIHKYVRLKGIMGVVLLSVTVAGAAGIIYGKYYASRNNKGIVMASNLYFNSDKLKKSTGVTNIDDIINNEEVLNSINVFTNTGSWSTTTLPLSFEIRNYDNNILYNDNKLDIEYKLECILLDDPVGAKYSIKSQDGSVYNLDKKGSKVEITSTLKGGTLKSDTFAAQITMTSKEDYKAARVLVMAYPVNPDYVHKEKDENQEYRLLGIFKGHITELEMSIENAGFIVQENENYNDSTWKNLVKDLSGYVYNIKTTGDVVTDAETSSKQEIKVTWDTEYITIDEYDDSYLAAKEYEEEAKQAAVEEAEAKGEPVGNIIYDKYIIDNGDGTMSMIVKVLPYNSVDVTFYKTDKFKDALNSQPADSAGRKWFEELVKTEINR